MTIGPLAADPARSVAPPAPITLRAAAGRHLLVGCAIATADLQDKRLAGLIANQFNGLTPEYKMMPQNMVDDGHYTFARTDAMVAFAQVARAVMLQLSQARVSMQRQTLLPLSSQT